MRLTRNQTVYLTTATLLLLTFACRALTRAISTDTPTPQLTSTPQSIAAQTFTPIPSPTPLALSCPSLAKDILDTAIASNQHTSGNDSGREGHEICLVIYPVNGNDLGDPQYESVPNKYSDEQHNEETQKRIWDYFSALIPIDQRTELDEYRVMTDGPENLLAAVSQTKADPYHWSLEVDIADTSDTYNLTYTLIHEFGHLLTLNPDQVVPSILVFNNPDDNQIYHREVDACPQYFSGEGCSLPRSYINTFYNRFWADIYGEWQAIDQEQNDQKYYDRLDQFYSKYQDRFVTDYAPTNPGEDIAESWAFFILEPKPAGDTIAEQKVLFFYEYPELVQLRDQILNNLCLSFPR